MKSAGREQDVYSLLSSCIGFFPTAPVWVNSYHPWGLGRFLQEDALEGSASLPASQNRYIYCQNDPISLIDPTGYSPENTGTPSRFGQGNPANYSSSQHACIVSPWDGFDAKSGNFWFNPNELPAGARWRPCEDSKEDSKDGNNGKNGVSWRIMNANGDVIAEDKGDGSGPTFYEIDKDGNLKLDEEGNPIPLDNVEDIAKAIRIMQKMPTKLTSEAWSQPNFTGERTSVLVVMKARGINGAEDNYLGFSISNLDYGPYWKPSFSISFFDHTGGVGGDGTNQDFTQLDRFFDQFPPSLRRDIPLGGLFVLELDAEKSYRDPDKYYSFVNYVSGTYYEFSDGSFEKQFGIQDFIIYGNFFKGIGAKVPFYPTNQDFLQLNNHNYIYLLNILRRVYDESIA